MTSPFHLLWSHIEICPRCSGVDLDLCPVGDAFQRDAIERTTKMICPDPPEPKGDAS